MLGAAPGSQASEMGSDSRGLDVDELKRLHFLGNLRFNLEIEFFLENNLQEYSSFHLNVG